MERNPTITCRSQDGVTVFEYYALRDAGVPSEHVGWVLIVDGPTPVGPAALTAAELIGDLHSMQIDDDGIHDLIRACTEEMLAELRSRPDAGDASSTTATRIDLLGRELARLPPVEPQ